MDTLRWSEVEEKFKHVADRLGRPIDDGIFKTVVALNVLGISTYMSCEGHLDHGLPYPWVAIGTQAEETLEEKEQQERSRLLLHQMVFGHLADFYSTRHVSYDRIITSKQIGRGIRIYSQGGDFLELVSLDLTERLSKLHEYQDEMNAFTEFLRAAYNKEYDGIGFLDK